MIDFTNAKEELNIFKGSEKKKTLRYNNKKYLVKFPDPIREKNKNISYINNAYSEYIGSNIFNIVGFKTQNVILGTYTYHNKKKIVCACEDFTNDNEILYEFENLALSVNPDKKINTEINDILKVIDSSSNYFDIKLIKNKFWDMFIIDALIGNTNRHNGNWGFLYNKNDNTLNFAPIYDCGSALNPMLDDTKIKELNENEIKNLAINIHSCLKENDQKIAYFEYLQNPKNIACQKALIRIFKNIDMEKIKNFIIEIDSLNQIHKDFYLQILTIRYNLLSKIYDSIANK